MKVLAPLFFILAGYGMCFAAADTKVLFMGEWSKPISLRDKEMHQQSIRGRLLIVQGWAPGYSGPGITNGAMTFVELQNVTGANAGVLEVCFAVTNLSCKLSDTAGKDVPLPSGGSGWSGRGPYPPYWVSLPYNSTIRLYVNGGTKEPLTLYPGGEPWLRWFLAASDTNSYFLSGTLYLFTGAKHPVFSSLPQVGEMDYKQNCTGTLSFPPVKIIAGAK